MPKHFPFHEFSGKPYDLGRDHGETLAVAVRKQAEDTLQMAASAGMTREAALKWSSEQLPKIEKWGPHWIDELQGLADGAKISLVEAVAIQVRPGSGRMIGGCTAIAAGDGATTDGRAIGAQNRDLLFGFRERMVVAAFRPEGRTSILTHTVPGELGGTGLNGHGLAVFANSLTSRSGRNWMAAPIFRRALLETKDADAAAELCKKMDGPAIGSFLVVDAAGRMRNLEIMPERVAVIARERGVFAHTNHCLDAEQQKFEKQPLDSPGSLHRCRTMEAAMEKVAGRIDVAEMKRLLSQHSEEGESNCRHADQTGEHETAATSIVETATRRLHISYGPPCEQRWASYSL